MNSAFLNEMSKIGPFNYMIEIAARLLSAAVVVATFSFLYLFLPNTRIKLFPAIIGGLFATFMWVAVGWAFSSFIVGSTNYTVIYSAFAALILFMIWLYILWLIVLAGSSVSFYV
jgi:membrane protein